MNRLVRAELLKLRTSRMLYLNALAALAFVPVSVATSKTPCGPTTMSLRANALSGKAANSAS